MMAIFAAKIITGFPRPSEDHHMSRKDMMKLGYSVAAKTDGHSVSFTLSAPGESDRTFSSSTMAWVFAERLRSRNEIIAAYN